MEPRVLQTDDRGSGPAVILIPGGLTGWVSWEPHQLRLADSYRVIRVQPIHNELGSAGAPGDLSYTAEIDRESLRLTLENLGVETAAFAGWSRGGGAAVEYVLEYPSQVRSLTLIEPEVSWVLSEDESLGPDLSREDMAFLDAIVGTEVSENDLARLLTIFGMTEDSKQAKTHPMWEIWVKHRNALSWPYENTTNPKRSTTDLETIQCPVLLIKGTNSAPRDRAIVDALGRYIANAQIVELNGGHASHIESIDRFLEEFETRI